MKYCTIEGNKVKVTIPEMLEWQALEKAIIESAARHNSVKVDPMIEGNQVRVNIALPAEMDEAEIQYFSKEIEDAIYAYLVMES
ncbi:MAG: hypothetical protein K2H53_01465 [Clostridia bacterium]|nr:hypothetical protein [Clostridia bacterium]